MSSPLLIRDLHVIDVETGAVAERDVEIREGIFVEIDSSIAPSPSHQVVEAKGAFALPGLIDAHVHVSALTPDLGEVPHLPPSYVHLGAARIMAGMLDRGFTTIRDTGGADFGLARAQAEGLIDGPRLIFGGKGMSQTGGHGDRRQRGSSAWDPHRNCAGTTQIVDGVEAVRLAAREELRRGASHIKLLASGGVTSPTDEVSQSQYSDEEIAAAADEARRAGAYLTVHAYPSGAIIRAIAAGARCIEHGNLADESAFKAIITADAYLVPTIVTYWAMRRHAEDLPEHSRRKFGAVLEIATNTVEAAYRYGVNLVYGSDLLGPMHEAQNIEFRIRADVQPNLDVIRSATVTAAALLRRPDLGRVAVGGTADMILLDTNPLDSIDALAEPHAHLRAVVQGGVMVRDFGL